MRTSLVIVACVLGLAGRAQAGPVEAREAEQLRAFGQKAVAEGDDRWALRCLEAAYLRAPSPTILLDIAEVHLRLGEVPLARGTLRVLVNDAEDDPAQRGVVDHARLRLRELERDQPPAAPADEAAPVAAVAVTPAPATAAAPGTADPLQIGRAAAAPRRRVERSTVAFIVVGSLAGLALTIGPIAMASVR